MGANKRLQLGVFVRGQGHRARKRNGHGPGPYRERGRRNMTRACLSFYTLFTQNVLAQDLRNGHLGRSSPTTALSACGWLPIAWLSTVVVCIVGSRSKSIGVYHTQEPHPDTMMPCRSASTSVGAPCEGLQ